MSPILILLRNNVVLLRNQLIYQNTPSDFFDNKE